MDTLTPLERSERMGRIKSKNTKPELAVRRLVHSMGFRYRLHDGRLAGRPDLVFSRKRKVIFVHGCFWHRHASCRLARMPKSRLEFWRPKLDANVERDHSVQRQLAMEGWSTLTIWECEVTDRSRLSERVYQFLSNAETI
jgi:DNA mismatch endonuclease, patch repair protein